MSFQTEKKGLAGIIAASSVGTLIEWYDFYIFGSLATIIATILTRVGSTKHLADDLIGVSLLAVEVNGNHWLLHQLAIFKTRCPENDIIGIPFSQTIVGKVW